MDTLGQADVQDQIALADEASSKVNSRVSDDHGADDEIRPYSYADFCEYFAMARSHIMHEDHLINHRLTWNLLFQAGLFTAYGVATREGSLNPFFSLAPMIPWVGVIVSLLTLMGVFAAWWSMKAVRAEWSKQLRRHDRLVKGGKHRQYWFPQVQGKGIALAFGTISYFSLATISLIGWFSLGLVQLIKVIVH